LPPYFIDPDMVDILIEEETAEELAEENPTEPGEVYE
jgi:Asp-tRNA(Asn)/Glu-tRNA(Gln) amidotransferase B subunit